MAQPLTLLLLGDQDPTIVAHQAIPRALAFTAETLGLTIRFHWFDSVAAEQGLPPVMASGACPGARTAAAWGG